MGKLPDLEGLAIFAKVVELRSFARTAEDLQLSKATVSKAVARLETKLRARLFHRTSRCLALTHEGHQLAERAAAVLAHGEAAESEAFSQNVRARGLVRLAAPMTFGVLHIAPLLPAFFRDYPEVSIDLHLSDEVIDIIGGGFDAAIRIAALPDSSLVARKLCSMPIYLVAAPAYLDAHGRPTHPRELSGHVALQYAYQLTKDVWRLRKKSGEVATARPSGPLRVNNGYAMLPCLIAGLGIGVEPEFIARPALNAGELEIVLPEWSLPASAMYWVTPPGGLKTKRVDALADYFARHFGQKKST
ncbi:MAG: LysR family transcriptional regulator [Alphaproteobacteria bacterium]|jgi:DNA-binding transcriptional LysR family regulator|nr:LysR family transcriptional regulator [Alphaproteobacteria bacterium]